MSAHAQTTLHKSAPAALVAGMTLDDRDRNDLRRPDLLAGHAAPAPRHSIQLRRPTGLRRGTLAGWCRHSSKPYGRTRKS
jgi:hypothetical protein